MKHTILTPLSRLLPVVAAASLTLLCAACTQDEAPAGGDETTQGADAVPLRIASVSVQPQAEAATRATTATPLQKEGEQIYITRILSGATTLRSTYTCTAADGWQPADPAQPTYLLPQSSKIVATYPIYNQMGSNMLNCYAGGILPLPPPSDLSTVGINHAIDYCYEVKDMTNADPVAAFRLKHIMAKVQFHFMKSSDYGSTNPPKVTYIQMSHPLLAIQNTIDLVNERWTSPLMRPGSPAWSGTYEVTQTEGDTSDNTYAEMLIIPASLYPEGRDGTIESTYLRFQFLVDGKSVSTKVRILDLPFYKDTDTSFDAGTRYKFDFILRPGRAEVKDVKMLAWETAPTIDGGETAEPATDYIEVAGTKWSKNYLVIHNYTTYEPRISNTPSQSTHFEWIDGSLFLQSSSVNVGTDPCSNIKPLNEWTLPTDEQVNALKSVRRICKDDILYFETETPNPELHPERYFYLKYDPIIAKKKDGSGLVGFYIIPPYIGKPNLEDIQDTGNPPANFSSIRCVKAENP